MNKSCREDFEEWLDNPLLTKEEIEFGDKYKPNHSVAIGFYAGYQSRQKEIDALVEELKVIANQDDFEMILDPTWAKRIATEAIAIYVEEKPNA